MYLVNWNDDDVRRYAWDVISTVASSPVYCTDLGSFGLYAETFSLSSMLFMLKPNFYCQLSKSTCSRYGTVHFHIFACLCQPDKLAGRARQCRCWCGSLERNIYLWHIYILTVYIDLIDMLCLHWRLMSHLFKSDWYAIGACNKYFEHDTIHLLPSIQGVRCMLGYSMCLGER